jgi:hypothetical protein
MTETTRGGGTGAGRPSRGRTKRSLWLPDDDWAEAGRLARQLGITRSEVICLAIHAGLAVLQGEDQQ